MAGPALAQAAQPRIPDQADISRQRVTVPLPNTPNFDLRIQTPERSAVPKAVDEIEFEVKRIGVEGATRFPQAEVDAFFAPLVGRRIVLEDLREAAAKLEARYREAGYFLTRVFVPPQQVKGGILTVRVVEGYVSAVYVEAPDEATRRHLVKMLQPITEQRPVSLAALERRLLLINDLPGIAGTGTLRPGAELGASELLFTVRAKPQPVVVSINNAGSHTLGPWGYGVNTTLNRPFGGIGALDLGVYAAGRDLKELRSGSLRYAMPLGTGGAIASLGGLVAWARPGGSVKALDIEGLVTSFTGRVRQPLVRSRANSLFLDLGVTATRSRTDVLDQRFSLDKTVVGEASLLFQQSGWANGSSTVTLGLFRGLPDLGSMDEDAANPSVFGFDPDFTRLAFAAQRTQFLPARFSAFLAVQAQYTKDTLVSGEQISFGGSAIGRGYDPSVIAGDRGIGGIAELRYDSKLKLDPYVQSVQFYGFVDRASVTTVANDATPRFKDVIGSYGGGVRLGLEPRADLDLRLSQATRRLSGAAEREDLRFTVSTLVIF